MDMSYDARRTPARTVAVVHRRGETAGQEAAAGLDVEDPALPEPLVPDEPLDPLLDPDVSLDPEDPFEPEDSFEPEEPESPETLVSDDEPLPDDAPEDSEDWAATRLSVR